MPAEAYISFQHGGKKSARNPKWFSNISDQRKDWEFNCYWIKRILFWLLCSKETSRGEKNHDGNRNYLFWTEWMNTKKNIWAGRSIYKCIIYTENQRLGDCFSKLGKNRERRTKKCRALHQGIGAWCTAAIRVSNDISIFVIIVTDSWEKLTWYLPLSALLNIRGSNRAGKDGLNPLITSYLHFSIFPNFMPS